MRHEDFNYKQHGFVGHLAEPDNGSDRAVIIVMVSPTHVPFEGTLNDKKTMTGQSVATWKGEDIPFVTADFSKVKAGKYQKHQDAKCKVTGMWVAYHDAYTNIEKVKSAKLTPDTSGARILLIAGDEDEAWPAEYSVRVLEYGLKTAGYSKDVKVIIYPHGSHLNGLMPNREREKKLYRMIPLIGMMYRTFGKYRKENLFYFEKTEKEIIDWITSD